MGYEITHPGAALSVLLHRRHRTTDLELLLPGGHPGDTLPAADAVGQFAAMQLFDGWRMIKKVDVRRPTRLEHVDDALCFRREMRQIIPAGFHAPSIIEQ